MLLFSIDRFSGYDRLETGTRVNVGVQYTMQGHRGLYARAVFGQSIQVAGDNPFTDPGLTLGPEILRHNGAPHSVPNFSPVSGLQTDRRDYEGSVLVAILRREPHLTKPVQRKRLDPTARSCCKRAMVRFPVRAARCHFEPLLGIVDSQQELLGLLGCASPTAGASSGIATDIDARVAHPSAQVSGRVLCSDCQLYPRDLRGEPGAGVRPDRTLMLRFELKHLGELLPNRIADPGVRRYPLGLPKIGPSMQCRASARMADVPLLGRNGHAKATVMLWERPPPASRRYVVRPEFTAHHSSHFTIMRAIVDSLLLRLCLLASFAFAMGIVVRDWSRLLRRRRPLTVKNEQQAPVAAKGEQAIVVLVNDDPVTAYQIDQRAAFLGRQRVGRELRAEAGALGRDHQGPEDQRALSGIPAGEECQEPRGGADVCRSSSSWVCSSPCSSRYVRRGPARRAVRKDAERGTDRGAPQAARSQEGRHRGVARTR